MIFQFKFTVETANNVSESQIRESIQSLHGQLLHSLSDGASALGISLEQGDSVDGAASVCDGAEDLDTLVYYRKFSLGSKSSWESSCYGTRIIPSRNSDIREDSDPRSGAGAEAVETQLELFKSVRRKPTLSEMMAEVVQYCNRG